MRTTSGPCSRYTVTASAPVRAHAATSRSGSASRRAMIPVATISWSSTSSTRKVRLLCSEPAHRRRSVYVRPVTGRLATGTHAEEGDGDCARREGRDQYAQLGVVQFDHPL